MALINRWLRACWCYCWHHSFKTGSLAEQCPHCEVTREEVTLSGRWR